MGPGETSGICNDITESIQDYIGQIAYPNDYIYSNFERLTSNAEYLLYPQDTTDECGDIEDHIINSSSSYEILDTGWLDNGILCRYKTNMSNSYIYSSSVVQFSDGRNQTNQVLKTIISVLTDISYYENVKMYVYNQET